MSKPKWHGWKEGVMGRTLRSFGDSRHKAGDRVRYRKYKSYPDKDGYKHSDYEYHVVNLDNCELIRTTNLMIDGVELPNFREEYENQQNKNKC